MKKKAEPAGVRLPRLRPDLPAKALVRLKCTLGPTTKLLRAAAQAGPNRACFAQNRYFSEASTDRACVVLALKSPSTSVMPSLLNRLFTLRPKEASSLNS